MFHIPFQLAAGTVIDASDYLVVAKLPVD